MPTMLHNALAAITIILVMMAEAIVAVEHFELVEEGTQDFEPRLFFANYTSSLLSVNSTILGYALLALSMGGAAAVALYYLYLESASSSSSSYGSQYGHENYDYYSQQAR